MDGLIIFLADVLVIPILLIGAFLVLRLPGGQRYQAMTRGTVTALTALLFARIAAQFYQGTRPFIELGVDPKASYLPNLGFPSDHALLVFAVSFVVFAATRNLPFAAVLFALSALVAVGRVLALVHTPTDVIGGFACALTAVLLWYGPKLRQAYYAEKSLRY